MKPCRLAGSALALAATVAGLAGCGGADGPSGPSSSGGATRSSARPTIVIEHGAFADASGWSDVIRRLQRRNYRVLAPANPLRGVAADAAYLKRVLTTIKTPVVLVGHSYGGAVITNAAVGADDVRALVYIAAVAPDEGESQSDIFARFPGSRLGPSTIVDRPFPGGVDQYVRRGSFRDVFAADRPAAAAATMAATQRPLAKAAVTEASGPPAWRSLPSWFMVARHDRAIPPAAERFMAKRARSHTVEVGSSHFVMLARPAAVTKLILDAVRHVERTQSQADALASVGATPAGRPERRQGALREFLSAKHAAERRVERLDVPWTILRFGRLTEAPGSGRVTDALEAIEPGPLPPEMRGNEDPAPHIP